MVFIEFNLVTRKSILTLYSNVYVCSDNVSPMNFERKHHFGHIDFIVPKLLAAKLINVYTMILNYTV